jgi:hypothetical protein
MNSKTKAIVSLLARHWHLLLVLCVAWNASDNALAYKVERVCEMTEPTNKKPAMKVCKTLLVKPGSEGKAAQKEEKKEEKPAPAHH